MTSRHSSWFLSFHNSQAIQLDQVVQVDFHEDKLLSHLHMWSLVLIIRAQPSGQEMAHLLYHSRIHHYPQLALRCHQRCLLEPEVLISTWNLWQSRAKEKKIWLSLGHSEVFLRLPPLAVHKHLLTKTLILKSRPRTRSGPLTSQFWIKSAQTWKTPLSGIVRASVPQLLWTSPWHWCLPRVGGKINLAMLQAL